LTNHFHFYSEQRRNSVTKNNFFARDEDRITSEGSSCVSGRPHRTNLLSINMHPPETDLSPTV